MIYIRRILETAIFILRLIHLQNGFEKKNFKNLNLTYVK